MTDKLSSRRTTLRWRRARVKKLVLLLCFLLGGYAYAELMWQLIAKGYPLLYYSTPSLIKSVMAVVFLIYAALPFVAILFLVLSRLEVLRRVSGEQWLSKAKPWVALGGLIVA